LKPGDTFKALPFAARRAVVLFGFGGISAFAWAIRHETGAILSIRLIVLMFFATVTARAKTKLHPRTTISFLTAIVLMAVIRDSAAVSIIIAVWGVAVQTVFPSKKLILHRLVFNSGMIALTAAASSWAYHSLATNNPSVQMIPNGILATILAAFVYFSGNSISMSLIVAVTQHVSMFDIWIKYFMGSAQSFLIAGLLAFFVGLASTGLGFMVLAVGLVIVFAYYCAIRHAVQQPAA
jgi:hypothetical protein